MSDPRHSYEVTVSYILLADSPIDAAAATRDLLGSPIEHRWEVIDLDTDAITYHYTYDLDTYEMFQANDQEEEETK